MIQILRYKVTKVNFRVTSVVLHRKEELFKESCWQLSVYRQRVLQSSHSPSPLRRRKSRLSSHLTAITNTGRHPGKFIHPQSAIDAPCSCYHVNNDRLLCALLYWRFTSYRGPGAMRQGVSRINTVRIETKIGANVQNCKTVALRS